MLTGSQGTRSPDLTHDRAFASCPAVPKVELYGQQWLVDPSAAVEQPRFLSAHPALEVTAAVPCPLN